MNKMLISALLGATLLAGGTVAAQNQTQPQDARPRMMRDGMMPADTNQDGIVTRDETAAAVAARFAAVDANKDGKITMDERRAMRGPMGRGMGRRMRGGPDGMQGGGPGMKHGPDANGDGAVTLDEQRAVALRRFDFIDRNGDRRIDQAERQLVREMFREMAGGRGRGRGHRGSHGRHYGGDMPHPPQPPVPPANGS
ncbi:ca2+ sensor protein [Sphingomonas sp.]|jgi:hypothetical protein|uniref:ca2+ sensor protein n=1 Tax=Sphingomonas sp. TaxID=28214 RepID=UPI002ED8B94E